jgi:hypothetical protein
MRVTAARPYTYETAISSTEYDATSSRELIDRLRRRLPQSRGVWARDLESQGSDAGSVVARDARTVVVLHDRMWGRTEATRADRDAIERRLVDEGPSFLRVVLIDDAPVPAWAESADSFVAAGGEIDRFVDALVTAIETSGGHTRADPEADVATRAAQGERWSKDRDSFLNSHRAASVCTREFDRLVDEVERRVKAIAAEGGVTLEKNAIVRTPGRCVVQYGPVALTISWVRLRGDSVADGRLMVIEWAGTIRRGTTQIPERAAVARPAKPAVVRREDVLLADAAGEQSWTWRREGSAFGRHTSEELAALAVDSLRAAAAEVAS